MRTRTAEGAERALAPVKATPQPPIFTFIRPPCVRISDGVYIHSSLDQLGSRTADCSLPRPSVGVPVIDFD